MPTLHQWKLYEDNGYMFCTGMLDGRRWETSEIIQLWSEDTYYVVNTRNTTYYLYYASRRY